MIDRNTIENVKAGAAVGAVVGGLLGAAISWLVSSSPGAVPVIGPTVGQGVLSASIVGLLAGAGVGALLGALFGALTASEPRAGRGSSGNGSGRDSGRDSHPQAPAEPQAGSPAHNGPVAGPPYPISPLPEAELEAEALVLRGEPMAIEGSDNTSTAEPAIEPVDNAGAMPLVAEPEGPLEIEEAVARAEAEAEAAPAAELHTPAEVQHEAAAEVGGETLAGQASRIRRARRVAPRDSSGNTANE